MENIFWYNEYTAVVSPLFSDKEMEAKAGMFIEKSQYFFIVDKDLDVYTDEGVLLFSFRKKLIPKELTQLGTDCFLEVAKKSKSTNRGTAAGIVSLDKISKNVVELIDKDNVKSRVKFKDGRVSKYLVCNQAHSMISGYMDGRALSDYKKYKNLEKKKGRETAFTQKNPELWQNFIPLVSFVDDLFRRIDPEQYEIQKTQIKDCSFRIANTIFTTVTTNWNFQCACHKDAGNLAGAYSAFFVCENSDSPQWFGSYLGYPQYGVAVNVREGDFLLLNPHEWHCNTEFEFADPSNPPLEYNRLSFVLYARQRLI